MKANKAAGTQLANWDEDLAKYATEAAEAEQTPGGSFISFQGGIISVGGQPVKDNKLRVVVLDFIYENAYYVGAYDPDNPRSPVCFALSHTDEGMAPSDNSSDKQHEVCLGCPQNAFGTAAVGRGKACKNIRRLALLSAEGLSGPAIKDGEVLYARVPVTSVKGWSYYVKGLAENLKRPPWAVITEIGMVPSKKSQFNVTFTALGNAPTEYLAYLEQKHKETKNLIMFPYQSQATEDNPAPKKKAKY